MTDLDHAALGRLVAAELDRWGVTGVALAAVHDGEVVLADGFGRRDADRELPVTADTLFDHGSTVKAFTAVLAATLVEDGRLDWDTPVREYWPAFALHDPVATQRVSMADLLSHRAGLARHEWVWLANPSLRLTELAARARHLPPGADLRTTMDYTNIGYTLAGVALGELAGSDWARSLTARVLAPLGMTRTAAAPDAADTADRAVPHTERNGRRVAVPPRTMAPIAPAGQLMSCATDMGRWLRFQLGDGQPLLSAARLADTHRVHIPVEVPTADPAVRYHGYALGWIVGDWRGHRMLWHSGGTDGYRADILLLPDLGIGVAACANHSPATGLPLALTYHVADLLHGAQPRAWSTEMHAQDRKDAAEAEAQQAEEPAVAESPAPEAVTEFAGSYEHPGYGRLTVAVEDTLRVRLGELELTAEHRNHDTWTVAYRSGDVVLDTSWPLTFGRNPDGEPIEAVLPLEPSVPPIRFTRVARPPASTAGAARMDRVAWQRRLTELLATAKAPGAVFALLHNGELTECAAGVANLDTGAPVTTDTLFAVASISKPYTATLVMQLVDEGLLDLDAPLRDYLPDFKVADPEATATLTARQLLTHTGGIDGDKYDSYGRGDDALERHLASCATLGQVHPPGATFSYCNSGYSMLGRLVEVLRGTTWDTALRTHLLDPLGADQTGTLPEELIWRRLAAGHVTSDTGQVQVLRAWENDRSAGPAGGVVTSARDLLRFARLHLDQGMVGDTRVLSEAGAAAMVSPAVELPNQDRSTHWGLGWELHRRPGSHLFGHGGDLVGHHARLLCYPSAGLAMALLVNGDGADHVADPLFRAALAEVGAALPEPVQPPPAPAPVDLTEFAGHYRTIAVHATFTPADGGLAGTFRALSAEIAELLPESRREQRMHFVPTGGGRFVTRLPEQDQWMSAVFYRSNGQRYLHFGLRAMRAE